MKTTALPTLKTRRLILDAFTLADAGAVQKLAGDKRVAQTTLNIPHPYEDGVAEKFIARHLPQFLEGDGLTLAIRNTHRCLVGCIGLEINKRFNRAELGYWIGPRHWNKGYCSEAARAILRFGFRKLALHKIVAHHFVGNPASGRVMRKCGMREVGLLRDHIKKNNRYMDVVVYEILTGDRIPVSNQ